MHYISEYNSPIGEMMFAADDSGLIGVWFKHSKYYAHGLSPEHTVKETPVLEKTKLWLDIYFTGKEPDFTPPLHLQGTDFQLAVWEILQTIPYGTTASYGDIAAKTAAKTGLSRMSPQAVGGAAGRNRLSVIVPCHRVVGANGSLTGYAGGIDKKIQLLRYEGAFKEEFFA